VRLPKVNPVIPDRSNVPPENNISDPLPEINDTTLPELSLNLNAPFAISYK
jgi:hypothetical protein